MEEQRDRDQHAVQFQLSVRDAEQHHYAQSDQQRRADRDGDGTGERVGRSRADGGDLDEFPGPDGGEQRDAQLERAGERERIGELRRLRQYSGGRDDYGLRVEEQRDGDQHAVQFRLSVRNAEQHDYAQSDQQRRSDRDGHGAGECIDRGCADRGPLDEFPGPDGGEQRDT